MTARNVEHRSARAGTYAPARLTARAPHVRSALDVPRVMRWVVIAALPCVAVAIYNAGHQASAAAATGPGTLPVWRLRILELLGSAPPELDAFSCILHGVLCFAPLLAVSFLTGGFWEELFARMRGRPSEHVALPVISLLFSLCLPPSLPLWQAALGCSVAFVVGKEIFGGFGRNFANPALTGLAFLYFAYPGSLTGDAVWVAVDGYSGATPLALASRGGMAAVLEAGYSLRDLWLGGIPGALGETSALACAIGGAVLLAAGIASWRILAGGLLGLVGAVLLAQLLGAASPMASLPLLWHVLAGGFAFGLVFLATDPVTSAATEGGRWLYGGLIGALVVTIRIANPAHLEGVMLAILFGNVTAPLLDQVVARIQMRRRRARDVG